MALPYDFTTGSLPSGVTASGGANGTRVNSSGNLVTSGAARFDYNVSTPFASRGVLVEPSATNNEYPNDVGSWDSGGLAGVIVTSSQTTGPDGVASSAGKFAEDTSTGFHFGGPTGVVSFNAATWVWSIYAKAGTASIIQLLFGGPASNEYANFDLSSGVVGSKSSGATSGIEAASNGFYRCWVSATCGSSSTGVYVALINSTTATRLAGYTGTGRYVYLAGGQVEPGVTPSTSIPTTSAAVTRSADVISFTIPAGVTTLRYTFDDSTTQDVTVTSGAYTVPTTLNRSRITGIADPNASGGTTTTLTPGPGSEAITGQQPTLTFGTGVFPGAGSETIAGQSPALTTALNPAAGAETVAGQSPGLKTALNPGTGAETISGQQPNVVVSTPNSLSPGPGAETISGQQPSVTATNNQTLAPGAGSVVVAGQTPTLVTATNPGAGALTIVGQAAGLKLSLSPANGALTITGQTAIVSSGGPVFPGSGALFITGQQPKVSGQRSLISARQRIRRMA